MAYNRKKQLQDNIEAIRTAFTLKKENREPDDSEHEKLSRYRGFGGLKCILWDPGKTEESKLSDSDKPLLPLVKELHALVRRNSSGTAEYKARMDSLKGSVLTGFYTPPALTDAVGETVFDQRMRGLEILDPSAGLGAFSRMLSVYCPSARVTNFEQDVITGMVLSALNGSDTVHVAGFEEMPAAMAGTFDMVMSNIPFGNFRVFDKAYASHADPVRRSSLNAIHNFFFVKGIDSLREGGILAYVTTRGVADSPSNDQYRRWLVNNADLISAIRLPDNLFTDYAGTSAGTDLLVFQKSSGKGPLHPWEEDFLRNTNAGDISFNSLFKNGGNAVLTSVAQGTNQFGEPALIYKWDGEWEEFSRFLSGRLSSDMEHRFDRELFDNGRGMAQAAPVNATTLNGGSGAPSEGSLFSSGGLLSQKEPAASLSLSRREFQGTMMPHYQDGTMIVDSGQVGALDIPWQGKPVFAPLDLGSLDALKAKDYIALRDIYMKLGAAERETGSAHDELRAGLNAAYERFNGYYGELNAKENRALILSDTSGREVLSLERTVKGGKRLADIFHRPVAFSKRIEHTDSAYEAMAVSLDLYGRIDPQVICDLTDREWGDLLEELRERVYFNPVINAFQVSEQFIAGDVITKAELVAEYADRHPENAEIGRSLEALRAAIPEPVPFHDLYLNFGERWVPEEVYGEFATELFQTRVHIRYNSAIDEFSVVAAEKNALVTEKYAVVSEERTFDGVDMLRYALYDTIPQITRADWNEEGNVIRVPDREAIQRAMSVTQDIRREYGLWLDGKDEDFKSELTERYNRLFNCYVRPRYDGSHLSLDDLNLKGLGYEKVHDSQRDAVWMFLLNRGGIADHKVGGGKTLLGCILAHEMKRLGISDKTVFTCIKANVDKVAAEYMTAYPDDRVLYPTEKDFLPQNREKLFHDIKNNDWDVIILTHEQFGKIPMPRDIQYKILQDELDSVNESLRVYEQQGKEVSGRMRNGLETRRRNLTAKTANLNFKLKKRKDDVPDLREMGIGHIICDESHNFKNLQFHTRNDRVAGIGNPQGSQRALDMLYAIRTLQDDRDMDIQATFMSGTTISNSLVEMYLLFKYHRPREMERQNIRCFDAWAATYCRKSSEFEIGVTGQVVLKERYRYFVKVPELANFYRAITDYRTGKDIGLDEPQIDARVHILPQTPEHVEFNKRLVMFALTGEAGYIGRSELSDSEKKAKMLIATACANKMAVDMRLLDWAFFHDHPDNKARAAAKTIAENYHKYAESKATQLVFCDLGVFKPGQWNIYSEIKRLLIEEHGLPADEIRFIQETKDNVAKSNLTDAVNAGIMRVVFGSTMMLGTGINMQERICALHHIDMPWTPKDLEQRNGRGARPGNRVAKEALDNKLPVHYYATEHSLDPYKYHLVHMKAGFVAQIKSGSISRRMIDEGAYDETFGMNVMEFVALLTGNDDLQQKAKLEKEIAAIEGERKNFFSSRAVTLRRLEAERSSLTNLRETISEMTADLARFDGAAPKGADGSRPCILKVAGVESADEKLMAERLNEIGGAIKTGGEFRQVGQLGPFPVVVKTSVEVDKDGNHRSVNRFFVQGLGERKIKYQYNNGYLASDPALACANFPKAMDRIASLIAGFEQRAVVTGKDVGILERMGGESWMREGELEEKRSQLVLLDNRIGQSLGKHETYDLPMIRLNAPPDERRVIDVNAEEVPDGWDDYPHEEKSQSTKMRI